VAQEAWIGVLQGIDRFEGRSALSTWLFRIVTNKAKTRGLREARSIPFSRLADRDGEGGEAVVERALGEGSEGAVLAGVAPDDWSTLDDRLLADEAMAVIEEAVLQLPERQRQVIVLRDVEGWDGESVCNALDISASNQRVLLHRARSKVRDALQAYLAGEGRA
jgi:RNA polymerase sigma-70 factor (ECF subfamily)